MPISWWQSEYSTQQLREYQAQLQLILGSIIHGDHGYHGRSELERTGDVLYYRGKLAEVEKEIERRAQLSAAKKQARGVAVDRAPDDGRGDDRDSPAQHCGRG